MFVVQVLVVGIGAGGGRRGKRRESASDKKRRRREVFYRWMADAGAGKSGQSGAKPEWEPYYGRHAGRGIGRAEPGRRSRAAQKRYNGRRFWPPACRLVESYVLTLISSAMRWYIAPIAFSMPITDNMLLETSWSYDANF